MVCTQNDTQTTLVVSLPGPHRTRAAALYSYRLTYRNANPLEVGCVATWNISGGRLPYQVAAERTETGSIRWYCTCADAVYLGSHNANHACKHVRGLVSTLGTFGAVANSVTESQTIPAVGGR